MMDPGRPQSYYDLVEPYMYDGDRAGDRQYLARLLQTWGPETDPDDDIGWALHWAIYKGDDAAVRMMIDAGVSPTLRETMDPGFTPLLAASRHGRLEMARLLWGLVGPEGRFLPTKRRNTHVNCLLIAARNGHAGVTAYFLDVWDGWDDGDKRRALQDAAWAWCDDTVAVLLADARVPYGPDVIQDALERAVGGRMILPEYETKPGPSAEETARHQRLVRRLIDAGGDPDSKHGSSGWPLLHIASQSRDRIGALRGLLGKGADPNRRGPHGKTVLHVMFGPSRIGSLPDTATLEEVLQRGALPGLADEAGETPLHAVAKTGSCAQLRLCLAHCGAPSASSVRLRNAHGESLLHYAAAGGRRDTVDFLLGAGLDVDAVSSNGWTPLVCALAPTARKSRHDMCRTADLLLRRGARAGVVTDEGWTALHAVGSWPAPSEAAVRAEVAELTRRLVSSGAPAADVTSRVVRSPVDRSGRGV